MNIVTKDIPLVIVGGRGSAGSYFIQQLASAELKADVISRRPLNVPREFKALRMDLGTGMWSAPKGAIVISFLPLWILSEFLPHFTDIKSLIAMSSTSRYSKLNSDNAHEQSLAALLSATEESLEIWAQNNNVSWTILRPTLIYDCRSDKNITRMAHFIRRWHFLPVMAPANGLRQPIHAEDVAKAAFNCLNNPAAANKAFNVAGGEVLSYRTMAERVFIALGQKPRLAMLPPVFLQAAFRAAASMGLGSESNFNASIFQRMNEDLIFDVAEGLKILDYRPRPFKPEFPAHL